MHEVEGKNILSASNGMNLYRGCTHGCIYCDARSKCYQMKHAFEDIEVKANAPELLEAALRRKRKKCMIGTGSMSDPYLHYEEKLNLTRRCLEIIEEHGFGLTLRDGDREYFYQKLDEHFPGMKQRYIHTYGNAYELPSPNNAALRRIFVAECQKRGFAYNPDEVFGYLREFPEDHSMTQMSLFDLMKE